MSRTSTAVRGAITLLAVSAVLAACGSGGTGISAAGTPSGAVATTPAASDAPSEPSSPGPSGAGSRSTASAATDASTAPATSTAPPPTPASSLASTPSAPSSTPPSASVEATPIPTLSPSAPSSASGEPSAEATPEPPAAATPEPSDAGSADPSASGPTGPVCSGTAANRDFFSAAAQALRWPVYCAVLPTGWFIDSGSWQLRNGGRLTVTYKGPAGARLVLDEGTFCTAGVSACSPHDHDLGPASFGDLTGFLADLGSNEPADGYAVYVNPGVTPPSWTATGTNLDQASFVAIAAGLIRVAP